MAGTKRVSKLFATSHILQPMECLLVSKLPEGPDWAYEIKLDGYRAQALCHGKQTQLLSRNGNDLGRRFPALLRELAAAVPSNSIVDGELVALNTSGRPRFNLIQNSATSSARFVFFAFDLLRLRGIDLTEKPLSEAVGPNRRGQAGVKGRVALARALMAKPRSSTDCT